MAKTLIDYEDGYPLLVNAFWGGDKKGGCIQITEAHGQTGYVQITRKEAKAFLKLALKRIEEYEKKLKED